MSASRLPMAGDDAGAAGAGDRPLREVARLAAGFHDREHEGLGGYRWMASRARLELEPAAAAPRFLELEVLSAFHDLGQTLTIVAGDRRLETALIHGWSRVTAELPAAVSTVELAVDRPLPAALHPGDPRELTIRVRAAFTHRDPRRHDSVARQQGNAVVATRELLGGATRLQASPRKLGIDIHGECNVKPPCVYCEWDHSKALEGENVSRPFGVATLRGYGPLYDAAEELVNCSIGEPFMLKELDDVLDDLGDRGKSLELSSNGQILTDRNIDRLLGRDISLYVSLDAATPETYRKLRNDTFDRILGNLRRLLIARGSGTRPRLYLVFMPMRINLGELEAFVRLCADLGVDRLVLRPLNDTPAADLRCERDGYIFDYQRELLPFPELVRASGRSAAWCERYGVELSDQMDFGDRLDLGFASLYAEGFAEAGGNTAGAHEADTSPPPPTTATMLPTLGAERLPLCTEPWTSLYLLRRGVLPCCHGGAPIACLDDAAGAWNGPAMTTLRGSLAAGRLHDYCTRSTTCPIVRKAAAGGHLPRSQSVRMHLRCAFTRLDRVLGGVPARAWKTLKRIARPSM